MKFTFDMLIQIHSFDMLKKVVKAKGFWRAQIQRAIASCANLKGLIEHRFHAFVCPKKDLVFNDFKI